MSSFKSVQGHESRPFTLEPIAGGLPATTATGFQAVPLGWDEPPPPVGVEEPVFEEPPPPPGIPEDEVARLVEQAYEDGARDGKLQAQTELASLCESLGEALVALAPLREQIMQQSEEELLKLSVAIARKVIMREITVAPEILAGMAAAAIEHTTQGETIVVRLNRSQYDQLVDTAEYDRLFVENRRISFKGDASVPSASCLVEMERGNIDAGVDSQLDEIMRRLVEERHTRHEEEPEP